MSAKSEHHAVDGEIGVDQLCRFCGVAAEQIEELVAEGVLEPAGERRRDWRFAAISVTRVRRVQRLRSDLGVNLAGAALAVNLLEEIDVLRRRLRSGGVR